MAISFEQSMEGGERFFEAGFEKAHTAVFFIDENKKRLALLKRSENLDFAPGMYTGVGGKIEKGEGNYAGAARELREELEEGSKFGAEKLKEFGRIIINRKRIISYFATPYIEDALPKTAKDIGDMEWVPLEEALQKDIIPTTRVFMEVWQDRGWDTEKPFTVFLDREDAEDVNSRTISISSKEGLTGIPADS